MALVQYILNDFSLYLCMYKARWTEHILVGKEVPSGEVIVNSKHYINYICFQI